MTMGKHFAK